MTKLCKPIINILLSSLLLTLVVGSFEVTSMTEENEGIVYSALIIDEADLLTPEEEEELLPFMTQLENYGNTIFQTVTLGEGADFEKYSEDTYYEIFGNEPGAIFQVDMGNRKLTLSSSTGMDEVISRERDSIVDNVYRYATDGDYLECAKECFNQIYTVYNDGVIAHRMKNIDNALLAVMLSLIVNFIIVFASEKKKSSDAKLVASVIATTTVLGAAVKESGLTKVYSPVSTDSGSSGSFGGGGGGGGGGFSGGSSSHGF